VEDDDDEEEEEGSYDDAFLLFPLAVESSTCLDGDDDEDEEEEREEEEVDEDKVDDEADECMYGDESYNMYMKTIAREREEKGKRWRREGGRGEGRRWTKRVKKLMTPDDHLMLSLTQSRPFPPYPTPQALYDTIAKLEREN
jgi:hypothetical protein